MSEWTCEWDNEGVLSIPQSSSITAASPSDCLISYLGHLFGKSYPTAEMQLVYSTVPVDWTEHNLKIIYIRSEFDTM